MAFLRLAVKRGLGDVQENKEKGPFRMLCSPKMLPTEIKEMKKHKPATVTVNAKEMQIYLLHMHQYLK